MKTIRMEIHEENGSWHGYANLGTEEEKDHYNTRTRLVIRKAERL